MPEVVVLVESPDPASTARVESLLFRPRLGLGPHVSSYSPSVCASLGSTEEIDYLLAEADRLAVDSAGDELLRSERARHVGWLLGRRFFIRRRYHVDVRQRLLEQHAIELGLELP